MTKVAIIEDSPTLRKTLVELIESAPGFHCVCACATSQEAQVEIPKHKPDVALMDIQLPDESGIVCTAQLTRAMPELQVIILTVYKDMERIFRALKAGACGYVLKRLRPEEILQAIREAQAGGAPMTSEIARMVVRSFREPAVSADVLRLTSRESELLILLAQGLSNKEIAQQMNIASGTVRTHVERIFEKLHVRCRTEAAAMYLRTRQGGAADAG